MIKALIIDDEPLARSVVLEYLQAFPAITVMEECNNGFEGLKAIQQHQPDIIFLDIQMPKINGFEMLELVDQPPAVIFTTAFDEYAIKAFDHHAIDYLLKPFSQERFEQALRKWLDQQTPVAAAPLLETAAQAPQQRERVVVKNKGQIKIIPVEDIRYIEAADDYVRIHTKEGFFLKNKTMGYFEKLLDPALFVRGHRSFMINIHFVTRIDPYEKENYLAILKTGEQVPVSKTGYARLKQVLGI